MPWYKNPATVAAIRNAIIALLLVALSILGYDTQIAQPRLDEALARQRAATTLYQSPDEIGMFTYCIKGGPCLDVRVR